MPCGSPLYFCHNLWLLLSNHRMYFLTLGGLPPSSPVSQPLSCLCTQRCVCPPPPPVGSHSPLSFPLKHATIHEMCTDPVHPPSSPSPLLVASGNHSSTISVSPLLPPLLCFLLFCLISSLFLLPHAFSVCFLPSPLRLISGTHCPHHSQERE